MMIQGFVGDAGMCHQNKTAHPSKRDQTGGGAQELQLPHRFRPQIKAIQIPKGV